jgi:asparagine synthase (glutamine-hydrolysing)
VCGIFGWLGHPEPELALRLRDTLRLRGPDADGAWSNADEGAWLGHRRLSIVDLTNAGAQPMLSRSGRYVITYNGEIFNHLDMRAALEAEGSTFRGHCDTETLLDAIERWGVERAVSSTIGFFAFAVWDRQERALHLARDRIGIKPLLYSIDRSRLVFASELRALKGVPGLDDRLDSAALDAYFRYLAVPAPETILRGVRKLAPGMILSWRMNEEPRIRSYWSLRDVVARERRRPLEGTLTEVANELESLLTDAVRRRLMGDVPVGAFLSGGVDSSTVAALMQKVSPSPIRTFTIAFEEQTHNEANHARAIAERLGTQHHERLFKSAEMSDLLPKMAEMHDEPFADVGSLPTYLVSKVAREQVTVALSGDGGDELFGGYPRYFWANRIEKLRATLGSGSVWMARALRRIPADFWDGPIHKLTHGKLTGAHGLSDRVHRFAGYLATDPDDVYRTMMSAWSEPSSLLGRDVAAVGGPHPEWFADLPWAERMMATDQANYMVDDILTKVDRTSMAVSLEVRVPILDHRVVEFAWRVPTKYKLAAVGDRGKLLLREVLYRHVPRSLIERPKVGFGIPISAWLRGSLREWVEGVLDPSRVRADGMLDSDTVQRTWREHLRGLDRHNEIWTVLMYLEWRRGWSAHSA